MKLRTSSHFDDLPDPLHVAMHRHNVQRGDPVLVDPVEMNSEFAQQTQHRLSAAFTIAHRCKVRQRIAVVVLQRAEPFQCFGGRLVDDQPDQPFGAGNVITFHRVHQRFVMTDGQRGFGVVLPEMEAVDVMVFGDLSVCALYRE